MTSKSALVLGVWIFAGAVAFNHDFSIIGIAWLLACLISFICDHLEVSG